MDVNRIGLRCSRCWSGVWGAKCILVVLLSVQLVGCSPTAIGTNRIALPASILDAPFDLKGDPEFDPAQLPPDARVWHNRLWAAIENPSQYPDARKMAQTGDLYEYGRTLNEHITSLMLAFRATGDLRLLDEVDRLAQEMRDQLGTRWQDRKGCSVEPPNGTRGRLRWLWLKDRSHEELYGRDTHEMDALMTHGMVAMYTYAFAVNRDLASPAGIDYGERADYWFRYLKYHFEEIWRVRNDVPHGFPFLRRDLTHPWTSSIRYHHYMGQLTGDPRYSVEVRQLIDTLLMDQEFVPTDVGPAVVWSHGVVSAGSDNNYLQASIYVKYDVLLRTELALARVDSRIDHFHMQAVANSLSQFMDDGDTGQSGSRFAASIGGDESRGGVPFNEEWRTRETEDRWAISGLAFAAIWDAQGLVDEINLGVYKNVENDVDAPRRVQIPAAMLTAEMHKEGSGP